MGAERRGMTGKDDRGPNPPAGMEPSIHEAKIHEAKTIHFVSLGCPKNRVDSEVMLGVARAKGFAHVDDAADAEVIVVNTCGFIGEAKKESIDAIFEMAAWKQAGRLE